MFREFEITFTEEVSGYIQKQYESATNILEYGSGGSTILAAEKGKTVVSVESSASWLIEIMGAYKEKALSGHIIPVYCDIGETKEWGYPKSDEKWKSWPNYCQRPWHFYNEHEINPNLILIDGRFRVACFIACCVSTNSPVRILFDDYVERPSYHVVEKIVKPVEIIGNRLAVFDIKPGMVGAKFLLNNMHWFYTPS